MENPNKPNAQTLKYEMDTSKGNKLYILNNGIQDIEPNITTLKNGFKYLGFKCFDLKNIKRAVDLKKVIGNTDFFNTDCTALVILSEEGGLPSSDLEYIKAFFSDNNKNLKFHPRIFIFLYREKAPEIEIDCGIDYKPYPLQADHVMIQLIVSNIGMAAEEIGTRLSGISKESYFENEIINILNDFDGAKVTISSTLTRRLYMSPKAVETKEQKKHSYNKRKNRLLKNLISTIQESDINNDRVEKYNLDEIANELAINSNANIPNREDLIQKLVDMIGEIDDENKQ